MFTGLIEEVGSVLEAPSTNNPFDLVVGANKICADMNIGDSISVNGACLTVVQFDQGRFMVELSPETMKRTNLGTICKGDKLNLERSLSVGQRFGGHFVQGHVDGRCQILDRYLEGNAVHLKLSVPPKQAPLIASKGFVALDGISLTVIEVFNDAFTVMLIPHTQNSVTLGDKGVGNLVNLETDILAKQMYRLIEVQSATRSQDRNQKELETMS